MSEFDKEAEREKLRKKLEKEEEDREATQRMSELLLKGATMTNIHCDVCGDPIFRSDGQEFCPTCQKPVVREENAEAQSTNSGGKRADPETETRLDEEETVDIQIDGADPNASTEPDQPDVPREEQSSTIDSVTDPATTETQSASLADARNNLIRTIVTNVHKAEQSTDIQRSRDHLTLAKDAAETLRTLQGL